jgi:APA family basic amino acid/polyamine antiporter
MAKSLGFWRTWAVAVGTMIGSGIFLMPAVLAPYGMNSMWGWVLSGAGILFIAFSLGSLASRVPKIGGPYAYTREAFGDLPGFFIAWGYWCSYWSGVATVAVAVVGYAGIFLPFIGDSPVNGAICAIIALWIFTWINLRGVRTAGIVQLVTTILKLLPLIVVAGAGIYAGDFASIPASNPNNEPLPLLIASVAMLTMWSYVGVEAATVPAGDVIDPEKTIPRALIAGALTGTVIYIAATLGVMAMIPSEQLAASASPFADAASILFGPWGAKLVALGAIVSILGALNSNVMIAGQMPRAVALDGLFPRQFSQLNARGAPAFGLIISAILATILIVMNYSQGLVAAFTAMALLSTLTTLVPYLASTAADLVLRRREAGGVWSAVSPSGAAIAVIGLVFSLFVIVGSGLKVILSGAVLLLAGAPIYYWSRRSNNSQQAE